MDKRVLKTKEGRVLYPPGVDHYDLPPQIF